MEKATVVFGILKNIVGFIETEDLLDKILGSYSNGETRSLFDAINGEFMSPSEKKRILYGKDKKKKKNKRNKHVKFQL